jgi:hypothetical protein
VITLNQMVSRLGSALPTCLVLVGTLIAACCSAPTPGECTSASEYEVKAAFLLNFAKFVDWPAAAFQDGGSPIVIGVLGDDPFGRSLDNTVADKKVKGRSIAVKRSKSLSELQSCQILFVSSSEKGRLTWIISETKGRPVLTVGDTPGFAGRGGVIDFIPRERTIGFEINQGAASKAGLSISSHLLRLAKIV